MKKDLIDTVDIRPQQDSSSLSAKYALKDTVITRDDDTRGKHSTHHEKMVSRDAMDDV